MKISDFGGETGLIRLISEKYGGAADRPDVELGIGDDAAIIRTADGLLIVTTDLLLESTHFRMDLIDAYLLGWKSAAVNISDIAAMGGEPTCCFVSIGLPDVDVSIVEQVYAGILDVSARYGSVIAGGDTVSSDCGIVINVTQLGVVEPQFAARRAGAKPGDTIIVTNTLGDSRAGLELLLKHGLSGARKISDRLVQAHLQPEPRVREARAAVRTGHLHAMMDLSDGLAADLPKLCEASGVGARVDSDKLPLSAEIRNASADLQAHPRLLAASGGEDYELLIACDARHASAVIDAISATGSTASAIGECTLEHGVRLVNAGVEGPMPASWEHFQ